MFSEEGELNANEPWPPPSLNRENETSQENMSSTFIDNKILRMMKMMGYQSGLGLGKNKQGITMPIEVESHYGKHGLGLNSECSNEKWDFTVDSVTIEENIDWLQNESPLCLDDEVMLKWLKEDKPNLNIETQQDFCDPDILHEVLQAKNIFDHLDLKELCQARGRANPFETIRCVFFMNRASLKMANIDAATNFMFTNVDQNPDHKNNLEPYYFADVCAGPGGFSEYVLWRKKWFFKGFGFTLRGDNDFRLYESVCACPVTFLPLYGACGDGNVCCPENIYDFKEKVLFETQNKGVHFVMADGGFSVEGNENIQEILSKNIYICQCLIALEILRKHGHFVTKVFDVFTRFSVGLLFLVFKCFEKVCILKPKSSRPANSERYFICYNYSGAQNVIKIIKYLNTVVERLWELKDDSNLDIIEIVPFSMIKNDTKFYRYIYNSNNRIAKNQIVNLQKLERFCRNPRLIDHRQAELRKGCLEYWKIPDRPRTPLPKYTLDDLLSEIVDNTDLLLLQPREIDSIGELDAVVKNLCEWHYTLMNCKINSNTCNFYAGLGASRVCRLQGNKWVRVKNLHLPRGTLLYGELVRETGKLPEGFIAPENKYSLHVIDALRLGDLDMTGMNFQERNSLLKIFCKAVNHELKLTTMRIRLKELNELASFYLNELNRKNWNFIADLPVLGYKTKQEFYEVNSVLLLKTDEGQSFHSSYVLRMQLFINDTNDQNRGISFKDLVDFVKNVS